jgi:hypothetical protein
MFDHFQLLSRLMWLPARMRGLGAPHGFGTKLPTFAVLTLLCHAIPPQNTNLLHPERLQILAASAPPPVSRRQVVHSAFARVEPGRTGRRRSNPVGETRWETPTSVIAEQRRPADAPIKRVPDLST